MSNPIRLQHKPTGQLFIVDAERNAVYADVTGDGRTSAREKVALGELQERGEALTGEAVLQAGKYLRDIFEIAHPGSLSRDKQFESRGELNDVEAQALRDGTGSVPMRRSALQLHLEHFDRTPHDGKVTIGENYRGWRNLGFSRASSTLKAAASSAIFGQATRGFTIDIASIDSKRKSGATGLYDGRGDVDQQKLTRFVSLIDAHGGEVTQADLKKLVDDELHPGAISRGQFRSLLQVCEKMNGRKTVTSAQFRGLFEGTLLPRAEALATRGN